jgi:hypothetical protein
MSDETRKPEVSSAFPAVSDDASLNVETDDIFIVVTQAFDGQGNSLVNQDNPTFDGYPGVTLWIELPDGRSGEVTLSPIHGDPRKDGLTNIEEGTLCKLSGAQGGELLDADHECFCGMGTYRRIYLSPKLEKGESALICDVWGCFRSRVVDDSEVLSWVDY